MTKMISWNVNGFRAVMKKDFPSIFADLDADIFCIQETKLQSGQHDFAPEGYYQYWNYAERKGYSGTAIWTKAEPLSVTYDISWEPPAASDDNGLINREGRVITLEFPHYYLVNVYTPNSQSELARLDLRMAWEDQFRDHLQRLDAEKPVILCGDLNVAHQEIDLKNPSNNRRNAGFTDEEREKFTVLLDSGFTDTFRYFYPDVTERYSWWTYRFGARKRNAGWRIDYFVVSDRLQPHLLDAEIHDSIMGSDHCPVELTLDLPLQ
ncbi:MAG TPA: exodeoxyribonuclease III [Clostridiaceae bacterium]|nr:exodeoxyribonuclease III [Clostridiaceae bacterium]